MQIYEGGSFASYQQVSSTSKELFLWPLVGACFVLALAVIYNALFCGGPLINWVGYLIPAGVGVLSGLLCALWYRKSQFYLDEARTRSLQFEKLSKRYEMILQSTGEGIYEVDRDGNCLFVNRAALEMLGYTEDELLGQNMHKLTHCPPNTATPVNIEDCPIHSVTIKKRSIRLREDMKFHKDGSPFIADTLASPVLDEESPSVVVMFRDSTDERAMQKRIYQMANFDSLTGLQNRDSFKQSLVQAIQKVHVYDQKHVLCYIDLDQFKVINDTVGHAAGDAMLQKFSAYLKDHIRNEDILGRLGGDEFGLILHDCQKSDIPKFLKKLQSHVENFSFQWGNETFKTGISLGVCPLDQTISDATHALRMADQACCLAKESGRNRYHIYSLEDPDLCLLNDQMSWVSRINHALKEDRFFLRYQVIERLAKRKIPVKRFEILISMRDESGAALSPGSFLPAAERYNLMPLIDRWVVKKTFDWVENNIAEQDLLDFVSINLSGDSITDNTFLEFLQAELGTHSFEPEKICFEITETVAIQQMHKAIEFVKKLKKIGCRFALDDFGSGMASFAYLKHLPIDFIKIDGTFISDMIHNPLSREIVQSIQKISRVMHIATIAEHAENQETLYCLESMGIDYVQGYIVARPEPLSFELPLKLVGNRG